MQQRRGLEVIYYETEQGNHPAQEWLEEDIDPKAADKLENLLERLEQDPTVTRTKFLAPWETICTM